MHDVAQISAQMMEKRILIATAPPIDISYAYACADTTRPNLKSGDRFLFLDSYIDQLMGFCTRDRVCRRIFMEDGRYLCLIIILGLNAVERLEDRSTWLTLGRLQEVVCGYGIASRNRVAAIVAFLENYGFVERLQVKEDRRVWNIVPTEKMMSSDIDFVSIHARTYPGHRETQEHPFLLSPSSEIYRVFCQRRLEYFDDLMKLRLRSDPINQIVQRESGLLVLLMLLRNNVGDKQRGYGELADVAGVSRTQVRLLAQECERLDLISLQAKGGRKFSLNPQFLDLTGTYIEQTLQFHVRLMDEASQFAAVD